MTHISRRHFLSVGVVTAGSQALLNSRAAFALAGPHGDRVK
jgi:hypothetical protein